MHTNEHEHLNIPDLARLIFTCSPGGGLLNVQSPLPHYGNSLIDLQIFSFLVMYK